MTKQTPVAVTDNDGGDQVDDDLASQRTRLVDDLAWLVVRSHRRRNAAPAADQTRQRDTARKCQNTKR